MMFCKSDQSQSDTYDSLVFASRNIKCAIIPSNIKQICSNAFSNCSQFESNEFSEYSELELIES